MSLTEHESRIREAFGSGERTVFSAAEPVRGSVLAALLLEAPGGSRGLWVTGATVTGTLGLEFAEVAHAIRLESCDFEQPPQLSWSNLRFVSFTGSRLPGLHASAAVVGGDLSLRGCAVDGEIKLYGAKIAGSLRMAGIRVSNAAGPAVMADHATVGGDLSGNDGEFDGPVHLYHARCAGGVEFDDARITAPGRIALAADSVLIDSAFFARRCHIEGEVRLRHARISNALVLTGSTLRNPGAVAVRLDRATIDGGLFLGRGLSVHGEVRAVSARIGRTLSLTDAAFEAPGAVALRLDAAVVDGVLDGGEGLRVRGELRMEDATVHGPIRLRGADLYNPDGVALNAIGVRAASTFHCCDGFYAGGTVRLDNAVVGSKLCFDDAALSAAGGTALTCWRAQAAELTLRWARPPDGRVDLRHARVGELRDDPDTWPARMDLNGLTYEILEPQLGAELRVGWLARDPDSHQRQPYEQLAAVLRGQGRGDQARLVLLARQRRDTAGGSGFARLWGLLQDATVGYGYRPQRAAAVFAALLVLGTIVFGLRPPAAAEPPKAPPFNALVYTLDLLLPIVDFGQQNAFVPRGAYQWISYVFIVAGLVLATTIAAGLSRSLRRT
ncbi:hypothetical protein ACIBSW_07220 [Actinoplanes sp. NPDC049668]|uniref:hypothetical protein n=1 Tax=unclassified Actinoplanes TaxID=2626549 RepID=UPI0033B12C3F